MLLRILRKSLGKRKSRVALATISVVMGTTMAAALLLVSLNIDDKIENELTNFGPNLVVFPKSDEIQVSVGGVDLGKVTESIYIEESELPRIAELKYSKNVKGVKGIVPYLYSVVEVNNESEAVLVGTWFDEARNVNTWWSVEGEWVEGRNDTNGAMVGNSAAAKLGLDVGNSFTVHYNFSRSDKNDSVKYFDRYHTFVVKGILTAGSEDDERIFAALDAVQNITYREDKVDLIQVTAICNECSTDVIAAEIESKLPHMEAKTVKQVADAQMMLLDQVERMMVMITVVALLASVLGVMTTMSASVVERSKEIGMMKAIGATDGKVASLFLTEAVIIGIIGGVIGFIAGGILAKYIGLSVFDSAIHINFIVFPIIIGVSIGVVLVSSIVPIRRATGIEPAEVLRSV